MGVARVVRGIGPHAFVRSLLALLCQVPLSPGVFVGVRICHWQKASGRRREEDEGGPGERAEPAKQEKFELRKGTSLRICFDCV